MRALVFANGDPPSSVLAQELRSRADLLIAADGGADKARALGLEIDAMVGDLDSAGSAIRHDLGDERVHHVPDTDRTDLQKAIDFALACGCRAIDVVGAGGGRADHALGNLSVLRLYRGVAEIALHDDLFEIGLVDGVSVITAPPGTVVSLVPIGRCHGVTTHGLRWDLHNNTLDFSPLGIHNEVATSPASVSLTEGDLLLFRGRWIEKHG